MPVQTAIAALATYAFIEAIGLEQGSWAVFSALFVIQGSVDGTLGAARGRLIGTAIGTVIGLGLISLLGGSRLAAGTALTLATLAITLIEAWRPGVQYGLVAAAMIILGPSGDADDVALQRAAAIAAGAMIATLASLLVFPSSAPRRAGQHVGRALCGCADLLAIAVEALTGRGQQDRRDLHAEIRGHLQAADEMADESGRSPLGRRRAPSLRRLERAVEQLWHTLIVVDRAAAEALPPRSRRILGPALDELSGAACDHLGRMGHAIAHGRPPSSVEPVRNRLRGLDDALDEMRRGGGIDELPDADAERMFTLTFALHQLAGDLEEVAGACGAPQRPRLAAPPEARPSAASERSVSRAARP